MSNVYFIKEMTFDPQEHNGTFLKSFEALPVADGEIHFCA
jgi:hypothetical protein